VPSFIVAISDHKCSRGGIANECIGLMSRLIKMVCKTHMTRVKQGFLTTQTLLG
jgi:hypothetical protein